MYTAIRHSETHAILYATDMSNRQHKYIAGCHIYAFGPDDYELSKEGKSFIRLLRDAETQGIILQIYDGHRYVNAVRSATPFIQLEDDEELLRKIIYTANEAIIRSRKQVNSGRGNS